MITRGMNCVVLAGGESSQLTEENGVSNKALIRVGGKEMISRVIEPVLKVVKLDNVVVVGPKELLPLKGLYGVDVILERGSILDNLESGIEFFQSKSPTLVVSSDIPFLNEASIRDFLMRCFPYDLDFYYPLVRKERVEECFPGVGKTYIKTKEGSFSGGNIFLINPHKLNFFTDVGCQVLEARKNPLKIASLFGVFLLLRFVFRILTFDQMVSRLSVEGIDAKPILSDYAELSFDIDKIENLEIAERVVAKKTNK